MTRPCRTRWSRRGGTAPAAILALALCVRSLPAQEPEGDDAWDHGRLEDARQAYEQVLAGDSMAFRPNLRVGLMLAWQGNRDSALVLIARARRAEPQNIEARLVEARVLGWARRFDDAMARYDSILAEQPGLTDAALGQARVRAWRGDLDAAERDYHAVLTTEPRNAEALAGLGYVYHWQGREGPAERMAAEALAADPGNSDGRALYHAVRAVMRPSTEISAGWSDDSDENTNFWQALAASAPAGAGVRAFGSVGILEASDPVREATRTGGEAGLTWATGDFQLTGAAGARRLMPDTAPARTEATYRGRASWRPVTRVGVSAGYARYPFDEIASLIERDLNVELFETGFDVTPSLGLAIYGNAGAAWFSDGNHRTQAAAGVTQRIGGGVFVGAYGRTMSYDETGVGYFSPDRFRLLEAVAGYDLDAGAWDGRFSGGLGGQQIGRDASSQSEWHLDARLSRRWGTGNRVEAFGDLTNSAVSSTTGAFRFGTAGVSVRVGL